MQYTPDLVEILREMARRRPAVRMQSAAELIESTTTKLRAFYYPKQRAFFTSKAKRRATRKTRRAGATAGGCRELLARAIELAGFRATYATSTRMEAIERAWKSDTKSGLIDILDQEGVRVDHPTLRCYRLGGVKVEVREADLLLVFENGSQIDLFGADTARTRRRKRGGAKHVLWVDEAQDFSALEEFLDAIVDASMADFDGEIWLSGTPGRDCIGRFYEITKEDAEDGEPLPGWEVHTIAQVDNPFFGRVQGQCVIDNLGVRHGPYKRSSVEREASRIRFQQAAGKSLAASGKTMDDPNVQREYFGRWVRTDARFVYPIHTRARHELLFAPQRLTINRMNRDHPPWYDHAAAMADLPRRANGTECDWFFAIGADFGYSPDPFALVVWAFCYELPGIYEMFSWKCIHVNTDAQGSYMKALWDAIARVVSFVGDPAGKQDDFAVWRDRLQLPIEEANKAGKNTLEEFLADDIRSGIVHLRGHVDKKTGEVRGSPLYTEMRYLVYVPTKPGAPRAVAKKRKVNGIEHGDHCCDAARYSYADLKHYIKPSPPPPPPPDQLVHDLHEVDLDTRETRTSNDYNWME